MFNLSEQHKDADFALGPTCHLFDFPDLHYSKKGGNFIILHASKCEKKV